MDCGCKAGESCSHCRERRLLERRRELEEQARHFSLVYVGWYTPERNDEDNSIVEVK